MCRFVCTGRVEADLKLIVGIVWRISFQNFFYFPKLESACASLTIQNIDCYGSNNYVSSKFWHTWHETTCFLLQTVWCVGLLFVWWRKRSKKSEVPVENEMERKRVVQRRLLWTRWKKWQQHNWLYGFWFIDGQSSALFRQFFVASLPTEASKTLFIGSLKSPRDVFVFMCRMLHAKVIKFVNFFPFFAPRRQSVARTRIDFGWFIVIVVALEVFSFLNAQVIASQEIEIRT